MKTLDTEQLAVIEGILLKTYALKFDDLRMEILDHIASETEALMGKEALSFELALKTVFKLWHLELQPKKLAGYKNTPRMVVALWRRLDLKYLITLVVVSTLAFAAIYWFNLEDRQVKGGVISLLILNFFILVQTISLVFKSNQTTVLNEYVKKGVLAVIGFNVYLLIMVIISNRPEYFISELDWGIYVSTFLTLAISVRLTLGYFWMRKSLVIENRLLTIQ